MFTHLPKAKTSPRTEYRTQESQRVQDSETLAQKYPNLHALAVSLTHFRPEGAIQMGSLKMTFNVDHAKSLVRFDCPNHECVGGDFDLSEELSKGVAAHRKTVTGELTCQGWRDPSTVGVVRCHHVLRFALSLGYKQVAIERERNKS